MELIRAFNTDNTEGDPHDGADPSTPPTYGWAQQDPGGSATDFWPHKTNDIIGELYRLISLGMTPDESRDQLRQMFYQGDIPPATTQAMVGGAAAWVSAADIVSQTGYYIRSGQWVDLGLRVEWANTNAAIDAQQIRIPLPYESGRAAIGTISMVSSDLQLDNPGPGVFQFYEAIISGSGQVLSYIWRTNGLGSTPVQIPVGDSVADGGNRILLFHIRYKIRVLTPAEITSGITERNTLWPLIEWYSVTHEPISPGPTVLEYRYDGALNGDTVELWDGALVVDSHVLTAPPNSGRGKFTILAAGTYQVRIPRAGDYFYSDEFEVLAS